MTHPSPDHLAALLAHVAQLARDRVQADLVRNGHGKLRSELLNVLRVMVDGQQPSALARRTGRTRQAIHYIIVQLETLGYLDRPYGPGGATRALAFTRDARHALTVERTAVRAVERAWASRVGKERFDTFVAVLEELAASE